MFSENFVVEMDSLVINKYNLPLKNTISWQFLLFTNILIVLYIISWACTWDTLQYRL